MWFGTRRYRQGEFLTDNLRNNEELYRTLSSFFFTMYRIGHGAGLAKSFLTYNEIQVSENFSILLACDGKIRFG